MMKYIGTRTISKNTKNTTRSRPRKTPIKALSRTSIHAVKAFTRVFRFPEASKPIGNSSAVRATMNRLMPSTPTTYLIPNDAIHVRVSTNWYDALPASKFQSSAPARPSVTAVVA